MTHNPTRFVALLTVSMLCLASLAATTVTLPYTQTFDNTEAISGFTIIDANGDGWKWHISSQRARIRYSSKNTMDDWLITPAVELKANCLYPFTLDIDAYDSAYPERAEVRMGTAPTTEAMTTVVFEASAITQLTQVHAYLNVPEDGYYYIGIHGMSDPNMYYLYADNLTIGSPLSTLAPGVVTNVAISPDKTGALSAKVAFNAPSKDMTDESEITNLTKIVVYCGDEAVKTFNDPKPGEALSFDDTVTEAGKYTYTFIPYNEHGEGSSCSTSAYIGINIPGAVENVRAVETANVGEVTITWDAVTTDADGNAMYPELVRYNIAEITTAGQTVIAEDVNALSYTFRAVAADAAQEFKQYAVYGKSDGGVGKGSSTSLVAVGQAYQLPYNETFANGTLSHMYSVINTVKSGSWGLHTDDNLGMADADGTNGCAACQGSSLGAEQTLCSGKISLAGTPSPVMTFFTYNFYTTAEDTNRLDVLISEDGENFTTLKECVVGELGAAHNTWAKVQISLKPYVGKTVFVAFRAVTNSYSVTTLDGLKIVNSNSDDLGAWSIIAPETAVPGQSFNVSVLVTNEGTNAADAYSVDLYRNDRLVQTQPCGKLESGESATIVFSETLNVAAAETTTYHAVVTYAADRDTSNDITGTATVNVYMPTYPEVSDVTARDDGGKVVLAWIAPDLSNLKAPKTETFDECISWATSGVGEWTFHDLDGGLIGGIQSVSLPIAKGTQQSFWVMDDTYTGIAGTTEFAAHSGHKYLAQMYSYVDNTIVQSDDWAVSPKLPGTAQTISFYARSLSSSYLEDFEVLYSTGGNAVADFKSISTTTDVPSTWTRYTFDLPAGAVYFAIRCVSYNKFMFMVDDVTFVSAASATMTHDGYNVYRDGELFTEASVTGTTYVDANPTEGSHVYAVSAVYNIGESRAVSAAVDVASVDAITADVADISVNGHTIVITAAAESPVSVNTLDGKVLCSTRGNATINVGSGIYIVRAGKTVKKVIVR